MKSLFILFLSCLSVIAQPQMFMGSYTPPCFGTYYCENFEGWTNITQQTTSTPLAVNDGWVAVFTTSSGAVSRMYPTNNAVLLGMEGSNTMAIIDPSGDFPTLTFRLPSDQTEVWVYMEWRLHFNSYATQPNFGQLQLLDTSSNNIAKMFMNSSGNLCITNGAGDIAGAVTATQPSVDTSYSIWFHYLAGSGANSAVSVAYAAIGSTRPTSGNQFASTSNGDATTLARYVRLTGSRDYFDKLRFYAGSTPPADVPQ